MQMAEMSHAFKSEFSNHAIQIRLLTLTLTPLMESGMFNERCSIAIRGLEQPVTFQANCRILESAPIKVTSNGGCNSICRVVADMVDDTTSLSDSNSWVGTDSGTERSRAAAAEPSWFHRPGSDSRHVLSDLPTKNGAL